MGVRAISFQVVPSGLEICSIVVASGIEAEESERVGHSDEERDIST